MRSMIKTISDEQLLNYIKKSKNFKELHHFLGYENACGKFSRYTRRILKLRCEQLGLNIDTLFQMQYEEKICPSCGKTFTKPYSKWSSGVYCSLHCSHVRGHPKKTKTPRNSHYCYLECQNCHKTFKTTLFYSKTRKFCSGTCRSAYNCVFTHGHRSKAEQTLYDQIINNFPQLQVIANDRKTLGGLELDIYIPELNFAVEWNGMWHYKKIEYRDPKLNDSFEKIHARDLRKKKLCKEKGIELLVIKDMTSHQKFIDRKIIEIIEIIRKKLS